MEGGGSVITPEERTRVEEIKQAVRTARGSMEQIEAAKPLDDIRLSIVALFELRQEQEGVRYGDGEDQGVGVALGGGTPAAHSGRGW